MRPPEQADFICIHPHPCVSLSTWHRSFFFFFEQHLASQFALQLECPFRVSSRWTLLAGCATPAPQDGPASRRWFVQEPWSKGPGRQESPGASLVRGSKTNPGAARGVRHAPAGKGLVAGRPQPWRSPRVPVPTIHPSSA